MQVRVGCLGGNEERQINVDIRKNMACAVRRTDACFSIQFYGFSYFQCFLLCFGGECEMLMLQMRKINRC